MPNKYKVSIVSKKDVHTLTGIWDADSLRCLLDLADAVREVRDMVADASDEVERCGDFLSMERTPQPPKRNPFHKRATPSPDSEP